MTCYYQSSWVFLSTVAIMIVQAGAIVCGLKLLYWILIGRKQP